MNARFFGQKERELTVFTVDGRVRRRKLKFWQAQEAVISVALRFGLSSDFKNR